MNSTKLLKKLEENCKMEWKKLIRGPGLKHWRPSFFLLRAPSEAVSLNGSLKCFFSAKNRPFIQNFSTLKKLVYLSKDYTFSTTQKPWKLSTCQKTIKWPHFMFSERRFGPRFFCYSVTQAVFSISEYIFQNLRHAVSRAVRSLRGTTNW